MRICGCWLFSVPKQPSSRSCHENFQVHTHTHTHMNKHTYKHTYINTYTHTRSHTHEQAHTRTDTRTHTHTHHTRTTHTHAHSLTHSLNNINKTLTFKINPPVTINIHFSDHLVNCQHRQRLIIALRLPPLFLCPSNPYVTET